MLSLSLTKRFERPILKSGNGRLPEEGLIARARVGKIEVEVEIQV